MKIIKLELLNLASLDRQGGETIHFEEGALGESTIFSIVGSTGSGKSTLLDAICLALYNRAPRYPRKKGDRNQNIEIYGEPDGDEKSRLAPTDPRNILTRGKKEGYSKLTFLANNGMLYRAEWYVRQKTKKFDEAITSLYKISVHDGLLAEEIDDWSHLPQIIGLDYEQFLRTVLIAQGSFANFLTAKENERYELLEKLIGCEELYADIASKIKTKRDEAAKAFDELVAHFAAQEKDLIPEEELLSVNARIAELEIVDKRIKEELGKVAEWLGWYETNEKHAKNIALYEHVWEDAKQARDAWKNAATRLALHDATLPAVALCKDVQTCDAAIANCDATLQKLEQEITSKEQTIKDAEKRLDELKLAVQKATDDLETQKPNIEKAKSIQAQIIPLQQVLQEKKAAYQQSSSAAAEARKLVPETIDLATAAENFVLKSKQWEERNERNRQELQTAELQPDAMEAAGKEVQTLRETRTLIASKDLRLQRQNLQDGAPCPLCGATHHPYHNEAEYTRVATELDNLIKSKEDALTARRNRYNLLNAELSTNDPLYRTVALLKLAKEAAERANLAAECQKEYLLAEKNVTAKQLEIKQLIDNQDPAVYERFLTNVKTLAETRVMDKLTAIGQLREELKGLQGRQLSTLEQKQHEQTVRQERVETLDKWLLDYNAAEAHVIKLTVANIAALASATDNWEGIRVRLTELNAACTSAETTLTNERKNFLEHQTAKPELQKEELQTRKAELEAYSNAELIDAKARIQRHEAAKLLMGEMFCRKQAAESLLKEWTEITDAIGGDGKTLRKIAQCYTLRFLIEHANAEIRKFNSRYELLQVKNSLGLRVIDHDRADDVRDTTSLSGGETFIVSLGLALGLSSLSSRNISFENLFIDEGFGTLDPDSLATVIDSLAMLQSSQGKKVGVISHTDTMSERITTQIRIIKNGSSGSSHIEVYPHSF